VAPSPLPQRWPSRVTTTEPQSSGSTTRLDIFACFGSSRTLCSLRRHSHFRTDRIVAAAVFDEPFKIPDAVIAAWAAERDDQ
jgi:hypothetical protein